MSPFVLTRDRPCSATLAGGPVRPATGVIAPRQQLLPRPEGIASSSPRDKELSVPDETAETTIRDKYAQQYAGDLEDNRARQAELVQALERLKEDEAWLLRQLNDLPGSAPTTDDAAEEESPASVPQPRQDVPADTVASWPTARKAAAARTGGTSGKRAATKKTAAKSATRAKTAKKQAVSHEPSAQAASARAGVPLHELVLGILDRTPGEPRVVREISDALAQDHPDRATSVQTVRNTLESLVRKNRVERSRQQGNVMYTVDADGAVTAERRAEVAGERASETGAEKVTAEV
jgi:predicted transcriptional regulator